MSNEFNGLMKATVLAEQKLMEQTNEKVEMVDGSAKSQDFF